MMTRPLLALSLVLLALSSAGAAEQQPIPESGMNQALENPNWQNLDAGGAMTGSRASGDTQTEKKQLFQKPRKKPRIKRAKKHRRPHL